MGEVIQHRLWVPEPEAFMLHGFYECSDRVWHSWASLRRQGEPWSAVDRHHEITGSAEDLFEFLSRRLGRWLLE